MSTILAEGNNFRISSSFGAAVVEGTLAEKPQGGGRTITFYIEQLVPDLRMVSVQLEPVTGATSDFWDSFWSNRIGGEPADEFALFSFVSVESGTGVYRAQLNADSFQEGIETFRLGVYASNIDAALGRPPLLSAYFLVIDDDGGVVPLPQLGTVGNETLQGGPGADLLDGGAGNDLLIGGASDDTIIGGIGNDTIWGGAGDDTILLSIGGTVAWTGPDEPPIFSPPAGTVRTGHNEVWAGTGNDTVIGGTGNDILGGGGDDDLIDARAGGVNQLWGGDGRDTLYTSDNGDVAGGGGGDDLVYGGAGADMLIGGLGNDTVYGYGGNDALYLSLGNDMAYGGAGDDTLLAGAGFDQLWGGAGADRFEFYRNFGWNRVEDFSAAEGDVLALGRWMWTGTHGPLTAAQVVQTFGRVNAGGDAVLDFADAGTWVVLVGLGSLDGLEGSLLIL